MDYIDHRALKGGNEVEIKLVINTLLIPCLQMMIYYKHVYSILLFLLLPLDRNKRAQSFTLPTSLILLNHNVITLNLQETLAAPYKIILHNRRFLKVSSNRNFRPAYDNMVGKDLLESDKISRAFLKDQEAK